MPDKISDVVDDVVVDDVVVDDVKTNISSVYPLIEFI
jgi:hypothetical protein